MGVGERHAEGGGAGHIARIEAQPAAVSQAAFGGVQFTRQSFPIPALVDGEMCRQPQAQGVKGGRTELALEALGKVGSPGGEVEQAQHEIEFVQSA
jgi:hypothetical protein